MQARLLDKIDLYLANIESLIINIMHLKIPRIDDSLDYVITYEDHSHDKLEEKIASLDNVKACLTHLQETQNILKSPNNNYTKLQEEYKELHFLQHFSQAEKIKTKLERYDAKVLVFNAYSKQYYANLAKNIEAVEFALRPLVDINSSIESLYAARVFQYKKMKSDSVSARLFNSPRSATKPEALDNILTHTSNKHLCSSNM